MNIDMRVFYFMTGFTDQEGFACLFLFNIVLEDKSLI